nr:MAG TPA: hypothetical protein [Caudoviricetes sp.]
MGRIFFFKICDINYLIFGGYLYFNKEKIQSFYYSLKICYHSHNNF